MFNDGDKHSCSQLNNLKSLNDVIIQFEKWPNSSPGGWTINIDGGGETAASEWINFCPFCGCELKSE